MRRLVNEFTFRLNDGDLKRRDTGQDVAGPT